jgi:cell division protein FtsA
MRTHIATGIDIGTYQIKVVISETREGEDRAMPRIIGSGLAESKGLRHGYIVNNRDVTKSVLLAVAHAEKMAGVKVKRAFISIGGISLQSIVGAGSVSVSRGDSEVTEMDVEKAIGAAERNVPNSQLVNRRIVHTVPSHIRSTAKRYSADRKA